MNSKPLKEVVLEVIQEQASAFEGLLGDDTPLGANGLGIDSIGCLELILELERRTGIRLRDEKLTAAALATPGSLIRYLEQTRLV